jgi:hypothetical protein
MPSTLSAAICCVLLLCGVAQSQDGGLTRQEQVSVLRHLDRVIDLKIDGLTKELTLYRDDMREKMLKMNELRSEVLIDRAQFVRIGVYEGNEKARAEWRDDIQKRMTTIETRILTWGSTLAVVLIIAQLGIQWIWRRNLGAKP